MNLFVLSDSTNFLENITLTAQYHCDRHVVKMIAESTQMLVTGFQAHFSTNTFERYKDSFPCKPLIGGHGKHPVCRWARDSAINYYYLACLAQELCYEHQQRYPLSPRHQYAMWLDELVNLIELECPHTVEDAVVPSEFALAIKDRPDLKGLKAPHQEAVTIYRAYYYRTKKYFATWKRRPIPTWYLREQEIAEAKQAI